MRNKQIFILIVVVSLIASMNAQTDSLNIYPKQTKTFLKKTIIPVSLIAGGVLISNSSFEKSIQRNVSDIVGKDFNSAFDDYTRYVPVIQLYTADILGVKARNHWFEQTKNLTLSIIITNFITYRLKLITQKKRPNGIDDLKSFPSGHTSLAFTNASVLYQEFKNSSPLLAYSGYVFATTTGVYRIMNNAHWISDVLVGAGIGILVTEIIYLFDPIIKWNPFNKSENVTAIPQIDTNSYGIYLSIRF